MSPATGTTRHLCPLECGWHHDVPPPSLNDMDGIIPDPDARDWPEYVTSMVSQASLRRMKQTDQALREHLATHTTEQFVRVIHDLRVEVERQQSAGPVRPDGEPTPPCQSQTCDLNLSACVCGSPFGEEPTP